MKSKKQQTLPSEWLVIKDVVWAFIKWALIFFFACPFVTLMWRAVFGE